MKTIITAVAATLFTATLCAGDFYHGLEAGNSDLSAQRLSAGDFAGVQPSIGDTVDRYQGWADGNPDLFNADGSVRSDSGDDPNIYRSLSGNPDLHF